MIMKNKHNIGVIWVMYRDTGKEMETTVLGLGQKSASLLYLTPAQWFQATVYRQGLGST